MRIALMIASFVFSVLLAVLSAHAEKRAALVVGNSAYRNVAPLPNTQNDAVDIAASFQRLGFSVTTLRNGTFDDMRHALLQFGRDARGADMAVVFFAGHGMEIGGENWLIPVDAELRADQDAENEAISLKSVILQVANATTLGLVILDSCRDNPFAAHMQRVSRTRAVDRGLVRIEPTDNVLVAYAAKDGTVAGDGRGRNSPFTAALLNNLETPGVEIRFLLASVRDEVLAATNRQQQPFVYGSLSKESIYLKPPRQLDVAAESPQPSPLSQQPSEAERAWAETKGSNSIPVLEAFIRRFGMTFYAELARARLEELKKPTMVTAPPTQSNAKRPQVSQLAPAPRTGGAAASKMYERLMTQLAAAFVSDDERAGVAERYTTIAVRHKALAASLEEHHAFRSGGWPSGAAAVNGALEACQIAIGKPCVLIAVDDNIAPPPKLNSLAVRDMPRAHYSGLFEPERIPNAHPELVRRPDVAGYRKARGPKAVVFHPGGRLYTVTGASSQFEAQQQAFTQCHSDPTRTESDLQCFLYAAGDQVVLPQRIEDARPPIPRNPQSGLPEKPPPSLTKPANLGFIGGTTPVPEGGIAILQTNSQNVGEYHTSAATPTAKAWSVARFPYTSIAGSASITPLTEVGSSKLGTAVLSRLEQHLTKFPVTGLLVLHDDQILFEKYRMGHGPSELFHGFSMSKTVLATLIGIALDEGRIRSIQDKAAQYVPDLAGTLFGENTIKDLLQMSSGADFKINPRDESGRRGGDQAVLMGELWSPRGDTLKLLQNWNRRAAPAGTVFNYHGLPPLALAYVLRKATGMSVAAYAQAKLWQPLGAEAAATWSTDSKGVEWGAAGFSARLRDWGRFGLLLAHDGRLRDRQIVSTDFAIRSTAISPQDRHLRGVNSIPCAGYGFLTWIDLCYDTRVFHAAGQYGQFIVVAPELRLVLVQVGDEDSNESLQELFSIFGDLISDIRGHAPQVVALTSNMTFFVTSSGVGRGGDLGGLSGADAHCQRLAASVGAGGRTWRAYLSVDTNAPGGPINARDRIGKGPWLNAKGTIVARDVEDLHSEDNKISISTALTEQGNTVNGVGMAPNNRHDILTGSTLDGRLVGENMTCNNWTSSGPGTAMVGHHDRAPQTPANLTSWNSAHKSRGCSQQDLIATGGNGLFYCFAVE